jgi:predicted ArsR family transcriptional regulator
VQDKDLKDLQLPIEPDWFMRSLIGELAEALQNVVGVQDAAGYISVVASRFGDAIDSSYRQGLAVEQLNREQVAAVLVDLKRRINGNFFIVEESADKIVLGNSACPFGDKVIGRPSLCMMTSNVFGRIAANNLGYAKVELQETIAQGHPNCRIVIHLGVPGDHSATPGRDYYRPPD